jgi:hypothetical protein
MNKKFLYLFLALLLPGLIFIFLKKFGRNQFDIPVYHQHDVDSINTHCGTAYTAPYTVPDSVLQKLGWHRQTATLVVFNKADQTEKEFNRIADSFSSPDYQVIRLASVAISREVLGRWTSCVFFVSRPWNVVLIDRQKRVRGYYALSSREDVDRLILEMTILLKKY